MGAGNCGLEFTLVPVDAEAIIDCLIFKDSTVQAIAFDDIAPQAPVHTLIIPKKHVATVLDVTPADHGLIGHLFKVAAQIAKDKVVSEKGFRLVMNTNADGGQTVYHIHLHLLGGRHARADLATQRPKGG